MNAYLLTGQDRYLQPWRQQIDQINAQVKNVDGQKMYPRMHGDDGWYHFLPEKYDYNAMEIYYLSMKRRDLARTSGLEPGQRSLSGYRDTDQHARDNSWVRFLAGHNPDYPEQALRADFARIRARLEGMRKDPTTPDARLADDPMKFNPASVSSLIQLMLGGLHPGHRGSVLHSRLRYFDPVGRRWRTG